MIFMPNRFARNGPWGLLRLTFGLWCTTMTSEWWLWWIPSNTTLAHRTEKTRPKLSNGSGPLQATLRHLMEVRFSYWKICNSGEFKFEWFLLQGINGGGKNAKLVDEVATTSNNLEKDFSHGQNNFGGGVFSVEMVGHSKFSESIDCWNLKVKKLSLLNLR